jgi:hypothetical protein
MRYPQRDDNAPESHLADYLTEAAVVFAAAQQRGTADGPAPAGIVSDDFEHLRWFELPESCLAPGSGSER